MRWFISYPERKLATIREALRQAVTAPRLQPLSVETILSLVEKAERALYVCDSARPATRRRFVIEGDGAMAVFIISLRDVVALRDAPRRGAPDIADFDTTWAHASAAEIGRTINPVCVVDRLATLDEDREFCL